MDDLISKYGSIFTSFTLITLGWFILFNTSKYFATRNDAKAYVNELSNLIKEMFDNSVSFWGKYQTNPNLKVEKATFIKQNISNLRHIRSYINLLKNYELNPISTKQVTAIKQILTLMPEDIVESSPEKLKEFCETKINKSTVKSSELILNLHNQYLIQFPPVNKPILANIKTLFTPETKGVLLGCFLLILYFGVGKYFGF